MTLKQRPNLPETLWTKKKTHGPEQRPSGLNQRPSHTTIHYHYLAPENSLFRHSNTVGGAKKSEQEKKLRRWE